MLQPSPLFTKNWRLPKTCGLLTAPPPLPRTVHHLHRHRRWGDPLNTLTQVRSPITQTGAAQPLPPLCLEDGWLGLPGGPTCSPEARRQVHRHVLVALLKAVVLSNVVKVVSADDDGPLHLHLGHHAWGRGQIVSDPLGEGRLVIQSCRAGFQAALLWHQLCQVACSAMPMTGI